MTVLLNHPPTPPQRKPMGFFKKLMWAAIILGAISVIDEIRPKGNELREGMRGTASYKRDFNYMYCTDRPDSIYCQTPTGGPMH